METIQVETIEKEDLFLPAPVSSSDGFIGANTTVIEPSELKNKCIIPSFSKDNESTISHPEFISAVDEAARQFYQDQQVLNPAIRVSHPVKGRIPEAMGKPANLLTEEDKTQYFERMMFLIEVPGIRETIAGNDLSLCIGGVRAYNHTNLNGRKSEEKFKVFVGFKNSVCINLCISTDGYKAELRARTLDELFQGIYQLISEFDPYRQMEQMSQLQNYSLTEHQFAQMIGRMRMYPFLSKKQRHGIPEISLGDSQISAVVKQYYQDESFCREEDGSINLWKLYNLFTGANKSSYIDSSLDRSVGLFGLSKAIASSLEGSKSLWYLS